jgi:hypothetical protein
MAHDVPIATEDGTHNTGIFRANLYALKNGQEGLSGPLDGRVSALDVPDSYIRVSPANYSIINRESGYPNEMYSGRLREEDRVPVQPTTSAGGRTDLVVFRVENPAIGPWTALPDDQKPNGPYVYTRVITNVPAGTTNVRDIPGNYSAITLARLQIPPSTSTITNSMITDLRSTSANPVPAPAEFYDIINYTTTSTLPPPPGGSGTRYSNWVSWPAGASWSVPVPLWATEAQCVFEVNPEIFDNTWGEMRIVFNGRPLPAVSFDVNVPLFSGNNIWNLCAWTNDGGMRVPYKTGGKIPVQAVERGATVPVKVEARTIDASFYRARGSSRANTGSLGELAIRFKQAAVSA